MARTKAVLTVFLFLLLAPISIAQSATGSVGLTVISGDSVETTTKEEDVEGHKPNAADEIVDLRRSLTSVTGSTISKQSPADCLKIIVPVLVLIIIIILIGHILYLRKKNTSK
jgi:hypothetical protein